MLVIFDLDGTLLNTIADLAAAANHALEKAGFPTHSPEAYPFFVGNGVRKLLERVLPEDARTEENIAILMEHFRSYYDTHLADLTRPYPGIEELLVKLRENDVEIAVASNKYQSAVERLIHHFFPSVHWAAIEGQKEGVPVKPDPSIVFSILSKCPTPKAKVVYIGDSGVDMDTAKRAGVTSVGVTWGFRPVHELTEHFADFIAHKPERILEIVLELKSL
ncbi:MAG: HAD family hydrolase [Firmicutes bacterium]|nr:HAD family hydrolase [Bacillota bacterium]MCM1402059.1 HAD family hydrolase [Bacteroides sp.]MCM1477983.1 HAD family hydrolase [Bacteroides sp.]